MFTAGGRARGDAVLTVGDVRVVIGFFEKWVVGATWEESRASDVSVDSRGKLRIFPRDKLAHGYRLLRGFTSV